jgi:anaerobic magnesium-protoporphyrin IX monomethyl ester cyclase
MKIALVYPPTCDPTAPYVSLPVLAACLRAAGHDVLLVDANLEAYERLLRPEALRALGARLERRLRRLEQRPALGH